MPPTETVVVEVAAAEQPQSPPVTVSPPVEAEVIVTPAVEPIEQTASPEQPVNPALEAVFAEVANLELSKPDLEPDEALAAAQAEIWESAKVRRRRVSACFMFI